MVFSPAPWVPQCPAIPDSIPIYDLFKNENHGRHPVSESRHPYTCGLTGRTYCAANVQVRIDALARALAHRLGVQPNTGTEWDKVVCIYSLNTIDYVPACLAVHRLSGIISPASAAYSSAEVEQQLRTSDAIALITCMRLLPAALKAARATGIPDERVFLFDMADDPAEMPFATIGQLIAEADLLPELDPLRWSPGQAQRQVAFLSYSSGTSGLPKPVMISHYNVIANIIQYITFKSVAKREQAIGTEVVLGLLPFSHIYGLVVITLSCTYRGDQVIVLPRFDLQTYLAAIMQFKIKQLFLAPPIVIHMLRNQARCAEFDLSSIRVIFTAAAPLGPEIAGLLQNMFPNAICGQGYGLTETATVVTSSHDGDVVDGTIGCLLPGIKVKLIGEDETEVTELNTAGELLVQSPSVVLGYLNNPKANAETFVWDHDGRWLRTGDLAMVWKSPAGNEHFIIIDRIKELIKVKGHQVPPAELEAHLLTHESVADCAVIPVPDDMAGEVPRAYVVRSRACQASGRPEAGVARNICQYVEEHKARHKWLKGGVEFVTEIPKGPSGKILRRVLREREAKERRGRGPRL